MKFTSWRYLGLVSLIALGYFLAAELGLSLASVHTNVSPVWPPSGIAIAALLLLGRRFWIAILLGAFAANLWTGVSIPVAAGIATGNTLEALTASYLLQRKETFDGSFNSINSVLRFVLYAVIVSPMVSATIGNLSLCLGGAARWSHFGWLWMTWWLGDGIGALLVAPFLLTGITYFRRPVSSKSLAEAGLMLSLLFVTCMLIFGGWLPVENKNYPIAHLCLPFLVWAALRFDQRVLTSATLLMASLAIWGTSRGYGSFVHGSANESLLLLQLFLESSTLTALVLFAVTREHRKAEGEKVALAAQVEQQHQRVEDIVAHVPGVVWEAWGKPDAAMQRIDFVSSYVESLLGYGEQEWLSTPNFWLAVVHEDDRERAGQEAARIFASGKVGSSRFRWMAKDGRVIWVEARSVVVCDESGEPIGMRGVTMDITAEVRAEEERTALLRAERESRAEAEEANRLKDEFLATVSHELRTPLNAIAGWARLLQSGQLDEANAAHGLEVIERNAWMQKQIIEDMLDASTIITGKLRIGLVPLELAPVVHAAIDVIRPAAEAKDISITTQIEPVGLLVSGDSGRLQQVAWNLLSNAVKFTNQGGSVEVILRRHEGQIEICVADNGPGIPDAFLPRAFDRFSQADSSSTRRHGGLGLGLAIARLLVELHGGDIQAANREDGSGAVVTVSLPAFGSSVLSKPE